MVIEKRHLTSQTLGVANIVGIHSCEVLASGQRNRVVQ
jgi:hypothetical protein